MLGKPIGAQRLGNPRDRPSVMVGVLVISSFGYPDKLVIEIEDLKGNWVEHSIPMAYLTKPPFCTTCNGFGHMGSRFKTWAKVVKKGALLARERIIQALIISFSETTVGKGTGTE